jgi:predicted glycosyltransferase
MTNRILVDITHPAHVHFFRNAVDLWSADGWQVMITAREKDICLQLLDEYGYEYVCLGKARRGLVGLMLELAERESKIMGVIRRFKPDVVCSIAGTFNVHAARLAGIPDVIFYDTENATISNLISYPFATAICTPAAYNLDAGRKHIRYEGYQELAYLHPNRFVPDPREVQAAGVQPDEPYSVVRFVGWGSGHDIHLRGFSVAGKIALANLLARFGKVVITSESPLPGPLEQYRLRTPPTKVHHLLAFAQIVVGESATMASEAVQLGSPAIYVSPVGRGYTDEQERRYDMCYSFHDEQTALAKCSELLERPTLRGEWQAKRQRLLSEKIDVTAWMVRFVRQMVSTGGDLNRIEYEPGTFRAHA